MPRITQLLVTLPLAFAMCATLAVAEDSATNIFTRRILPLAKADKPSSCAECHAAGVDLSQYIRSDAASTFAALRSAGLVNADRPEKSKLLEFIARAPEKPDPRLAKLRSEELAAFRAWITAAAKDPQLASASASAEPVGPTLPSEVIRHARRDRMLESFVENIWIERERCAGCHSPDKNQRLIAKHGEHISWITPDDPAGTLATIIDHGLIDTDDPDKSLILQKPLAEVEHGGHMKFTRGTRTDKQFRRFLHDYTATVTSKYRAAADLPKPADEIVVATAQHLRLTDLPPEYGGKLTRIDLHRWTDAGWSTAPVATVDGAANPKNGMFQGVVFAILPRMPDLAKEVQTRRQFPGGRYLARLYIDRDGNAARNRDYEMGANELFGEIDFDGPWPAGYQPPKILKAPIAAAAGQ
jgi:mono/diheme cytochrome c family protein